MPYLTAPLPHFEAAQQSTLTTIPENTVPPFFIYRLSLFPQGQFLGMSHG
jgi:hypothetical protein